jgi:hypothetical protein
MGTLRTMRITARVRYELRFAIFMITKDLSSIGAKILRDHGGIRRRGASEAEAAGGTAA